jgi:hypothetical protein
MYNTRPTERSHPAFRTSPEVRTRCGQFSPEEIRSLGFAVDIRQLGASEEFFQKALQARAEDARREGRSFRRPAQTDAEIRERAAQMARDVARSDAETEAHEAAKASRLANSAPLYDARIWEA